MEKTITVCDWCSRETNGSYSVLSNVVCVNCHNAYNAGTKHPKNREISTYKITVGHVYVTFEYDEQTKTARNTTTNARNDVFALLSVVEGIAEEYTTKTKNYIDCGSIKIGGMVIQKC